jgi:serine/threonine protein kinase
VKPDRTTTEALDVLAEELGRLAERGEALDPQELGARHGLSPSLVEDYWRALNALEPQRRVGTDPPRTIERFKVRGVLGRGGMGVVLRAYDPTLDREVAIKTIRTDRSGQVGLQRFQREVVALGRVQHPNIVPVFACGELPGGQPYVVLKLIEGVSLSERIDEEGVLPEREAIELCRTLADALTAVHAQGLLHRDVKPSNVLLTRSGIPMLTDFGLVAAEDPDLAWSRLSRTGRQLGSPGYWSPEQAAGDLSQIGPASDVYGLGATLFACLTGAAPSDSTPGMGAALSALRGTILPPSALRPGISPALDRICMRCLEKDPAARYPTAAALADDLAALLAPPRQQVGLLLLGTLAGALVVASATLSLLEGPGVGPETGSSVGSPSPAGAASAANSPGPPSPPSSPHSPNSPSSPHSPGPPSSGEADEAQLAALSIEIKACFTARDYEGALTLAREAVTQYPNSGQVHSHVGTVLMAQGKPDLAIPALTRSLELRPAHVETYTQRAHAHLLRKDFQETIDDCKTAIGIKPDYARAHFMLGLAYKGQVNDEALILAMSAGLKHDPSFIPAYFERASSLAILGRFEEAKRDYAQVVLLQPRHQEAWTRRAALFFQLGQLEQAESYATQAMTPIHYHRALELRGDIRIALGKFQEALDDAKRALVEEKDCPRALLTRANALKGLSR